VTVGVVSSREIRAGITPRLARRTHVHVPRNAGIRGAGISLLLLSLSGCTHAMLSKTRPDFVQATTDDAATLTFVATSKLSSIRTLISGFEDPTDCKSRQMNLGGTWNLVGERVIRLAPDRDFAFLAELEIPSGLGPLTCSYVGVFTPASRSAYRAELRSDGRVCDVKLVRLEQGTPVPEPSLKWRKPRKGLTRLGCE
jgi:hypothetical protein